MIRPMLPRQRFQWRVPVGTHGADQAEQIVTLLRQIDVLRTPLARFIECLLMALRVRSDPYLDDRYGGIADIGRHRRGMYRSRMTHSGHMRRGHGTLRRTVPDLNRYVEEKHRSGCVFGPLTKVSLRLYKCNVGTKGAPRTADRTCRSSVFFVAV